MTGSIRVVSSRTNTTIRVVSSRTNTTILWCAFWKVPGCYGH